MGEELVVKSDKMAGLYREELESRAYTALMNYIISEDD